MATIKHRSFTIAGKAVLILLLLVVIPSYPANTGFARPVHATPITGLAVWSSVYQSRSVIDTTVIANKFLVMRLNVSGGVALNGFDITIRWDPAVIKGINASIIGGIFDRPSFSSQNRQIANDHITWAGVLNGEHVAGTGMIISFGIQILATGSSSAISIDRTVTQLTQPFPVPYVVSDGFFSNIPTDDDLVLASMFVKNETAVPGDKLTVAVGIRNIGVATMTGVAVTLVANFTTTPIALGSASVGTVLPNSAQTVNVVWDTTGFVLGHYNLNATVTTTSTDSFLGDNFLALEQVRLVIHDLAATGLTAPASARANSTVALNIVLQNLGTIQDTANVTIYANTTRVRITSSNMTWQTFQLAPGTTNPFAMSWNTTLFPVGNYVLKAAVKPVPGETNLSNNNFTDGTIAIKKNFDHDLQVIGSLPGSTIVGQNVTMNFQVKNNGISSETYNYSIFLNSQKLFQQNGATIPSFTIVTIPFTWNTRPYSPGPYTLKANVTLLSATDENASNNQISGAFTLLANQPPVLVIDVNPTVPGPGASIVLNATHSFSPVGNFLNSFSWSFGDGSADQSGVAVTHVYSTSGNYSVTLTVVDNLGGSSSRTMQLRVNSLPVAKISVNPTAPVAGDEVTFDAGSSTDSDGTISTYKWDFGDGSTGSGKTVKHTFGASGTFQVKLNVTDNDGGSNVSSLSLQVGSAPLIPLVAVYGLSAAGVGAALAGGWFFTSRRRKARASPPG